MYIGCARGKQDIDSAIELATKIFLPNENFQFGFKSKKNLMFQNSENHFNDVVVIAQDGNVIGACFLIDRLFYRGDFILKGTFLSSICISESSRGKGLSKLLISCAITEVQERLSDFAILIARKAADFFYNQFNFWGVAQYNKIQYSISSNVENYKKYIFFDVTKRDLTEINKIYSMTYSSLLGSCIRSDLMWHNILNKASQQNYKILVSKVNNKINGYIIHSGNELFEFASVSDASCFDMLNNFGRHFSFNDLTLHCSPKHPIVNSLKNIDFSITKRQCNYGGHMVRIINHKTFLGILEKECESRLRQIGLSDYTEKRNEEALLQVFNGDVSLKLIESPYTYNSTCFLMGIECLSETLKNFSIFDTQPFNVPLLDQV
jgi:predicted acetyltransferase